MTKQKIDYKTVSSCDEFNWNILKENEKFVLWREFSGKKLTPEQFKKFQDEVNEHRPFCAADFVPQPWTKDLTQCR